MFCPYTTLKWNDLTPAESNLNRFCAKCKSDVVETKELSDNSLFKLLQERPETCLKIDFNQDNIRIIHHV